MVQYRCSPTSAWWTCSLIREGHFIRVAVGCGFSGRYAGHLGCFRVPNQNPSQEKTGCLLFHSIPSDVFVWKLVSLCFGNCSALKSIIGSWILFSCSKLSSGHSPWWSIFWKWALQFDFTVNQNQILHKPFKSYHFGVRTFAVLALRCFRCFTPHDQIGLDWIAYVLRESLLPMATTLGTLKSVQ